VPGAGHIGLVVSTFLASAVEFVEALTIVLAMGVTRGWRSALWGVGLAVAALAAITAVAGYALVQWFPKTSLQLVVGVLLLIFGLQWLQKAILRSAGLKSLHDEDQIFAEEQSAARTAAPGERYGLDWYAFVVSFKGVFLEGFEVIFIAITFGLSAGSVPLAAAAAAGAAAVVLAAGVAAHRPLAKVPENTLKFSVGLLLATYGTFWVVEGLGVFAPDGKSLEWPGGGWALPVLLVLWMATSWATVRVLRRVATRTVAVS
jgi:Ca2+/H+ antiporter, TMEM165/GDT1 family